MVTFILMFFIITKIVVVTFRIMRQVVSENNFMTQGNDVGQK